MAVRRPIQQRPGFGDQAVRTAGLIHQKRSKWTLEIAKALCTFEDVVHFKKILLPGSFFQDVADVLCGLLAELYPSQAGLVAEVALQAQ